MCPWTTKRSHTAHEHDLTHIYTHTHVPIARILPPPPRTHVPHAQSVCSRTRTTNSQTSQNAIFTTVYGIAASSPSEKRFSLIHVLLRGLVFTSEKKIFSGLTEFKQKHTKFGALSRLLFFQSHFFVCLCHVSFLWQLMINSEFKTKHRKKTSIRCLPVTGMYALFHFTLAELWCHPFFTVLRVQCFNFSWFYD